MWPDPGRWLPPRYVYDAGAMLRGCGEHVEGIRPEPSGYADFAVRIEAAKPRTWPAILRWHVPNARCSKNDARP